SPVQVTLDPKTANAELHLSEDLRCVWWGDRRTDLPSNPERFKFHPCVLGSRGFISGWHCWEVKIVGQGMWAMGVAKESLLRDQWFHMSPEQGVWALCVGAEGCKALTSPYPTPLVLYRVLQQIRICLNYGKGEVEFYDALSQELIFAFRQVSFKEETIYPWFRLVGEVHLRLL
ncbi:BT3A1 protein, partial [Aegotheles bennettii]|nr:BT3A1 protein [Aegotheles bennettii]